MLRSSYLKRETDHKCAKICFRDRVVARWNQHETTLDLSQVKVLL